VPEAQTRALAKRAYARERDRLWARHFAARLMGSDCPPAEALPDDARHQLAQLAGAR
jgi:hypothetical protein